MDDVHGASGKLHVTLGRRQLMAAGLTVAAATAVGGTVGVKPAQAALASYSRIGRSTTWPLRRRTGIGTVNGRAINLHNSGQSFQFDTTFKTMCDTWVTYFNAQWTTFTSSTVKLAWIGCSHVFRDFPATSNHRTGNAMDLTAMYFNNGGYIDCNYSHRSFAPHTHQSWYIGLAWTGRRFFPELGIVGTGTSHAWHIHMGRFVGGSSSVLLRRNGSWDAHLVQRACRVLMQVNIAVDGNWGSQTDHYFQILLSRLGLSGTNPFGNQTHFAQLVYGISARALAGNPI